MDEAEFINPNYSTIVIWESGLTLVRCRHCGAQAAADKVIPHASTCTLEKEFRQHDSKGQSNPRNDAQKMDDSS